MKTAVILFTQVILLFSGWSVRMTSTNESPGLGFLSLDQSTSPEYKRSEALSAYSVILTRYIIDRLRILCFSTLCA